MADDWATPRWLLELMFPDGNFFDPCPLNGSGGLESAWPTDRPVYINPPFSNPLPWVRRAAEHAGPVVMLLPVDPTTKWWTYEGDFKVILIGSRLHFNEMTTYARQTCCIWRKPARVNGALQDEFRQCEFCGCHTNAKARACCDSGRNADTKWSKMREALEFYADEQNYKEQGCGSPNELGYQESTECPVFDDKGEIARAAI